MMRERTLASGAGRRPVPEPVTRRSEIAGALQDRLDAFAAILRDEWRGMIVGAGLVLAVAMAVVLTGTG